MGGAFDQYEPSLICSRWFSFISIFIIAIGLEFSLLVHKTIKTICDSLCVTRGTETVEKCAEE
jgi:hypothetical protein